MLPEIPNHLIPLEWSEAASQGLQLVVNLEK
jgi:hypothetical protein